ncbi:MAG: helix-turn-helix transcriptional regulator [Synergistaceae bacterium]|nr:helix-turn-helix transcriptional regulator [Synergistaceae bacterium]
MSGRCPIESTLSLINGKWKLLILKELSQGPVRYGALERAIPAISAKVLTQQLREMETDGLVVRTIFPEIPPRVEYSLDEMGASIFKVFAEMRRWGLEENKRHSIRCAGCKNCLPLHV